MQNSNQAGLSHSAKLRSRLIGVALAAGALTIGGMVFTEGESAYSQTISAPARQSLAEASGFSFADLVERVRPAVVTVSVQRTGGRQQVADTDEPSSPFRNFRNFGRQGQGGGMGDLPAPFRDFGNRQGERGGQSPDAPGAFRAEAMGSGFIIDRAGYIVTNNHVIEDENRIHVKLPNGREYPAHVIGADKDTDIALLKIDGAGDLPVVELGDDRRLRVGDWVVAVGNPFGLGGTVTAGIVSSIGRDIGNGPFTDYIQIDAPINQGNSGGPTFDLSGRVVGMNTAIFSPSGGSVGIGFAIPASTVRTIVEQLKDHGNVERGWLGVQIQSLTPDLAASMGTPSNVKGAIVASVVDNSPAAHGGMQQGDVVVALNGATINDSRDLTQKVAGLRAGERVQFTVLRDGQRRGISVTIGQRDEQVASMNRMETPNRSFGRGNR